MSLISQKIPDEQGNDYLRTVGFVLAGQRYQALNGGPSGPFNDRVSLSVSCKVQAEVGRYWQALTADGGEPVMCGWLKDKCGLRWQIVPEAFFGMMQDKVRACAKCHSYNLVVVITRLLASARHSCLDGTLHTFACSGGATRR